MAKTRVRAEQEPGPAEARGQRIQVKPPHGHGARGANRASSVLALQGLVGNAAVTRLLGDRRYAVQRSIQAKLLVGAAHDPAEREADRIADEVMRRWTSVEAHDAETHIRRAPTTAVPAPASSFEVEGSFAQLLSSRRGHRGQSLPAPMRAKMESSFGADFGHVRVHRDTEAAELSSSLFARAFTHGSDIYFGRGAYNPSSRSGQHLLAHELTHVVQQTRPDVVAQAPSNDSPVHRTIDEVTSDDRTRVAAGDCVIRRDVGFEFQTGWGIRERNPYRQYRRQEVVRDYGLFMLTADEANTPLGAEIEFVVPHVKENQRGTMDTAMQYLESLAGQMNGFKSSTIFTLDRATRTPGDDRVEVHPTIKATGDMKANPQLTGGVRLDRLTQMFNDLNAPQGAHSQAQADLVAVGGGGGLGLAANRVANLSVNGAPASAKCQGLVAMLLTYLQMGKLDTGVPGLNQPTLNYGKASLTLLARTDYYGMFRRLPNNEKTYFKANPDQFESMVLTAAGNLAPNANVLERGIHGVAVNVTRRNWLRGIPAGTDLLKKRTDARLFGYGSRGRHTDTVGPGLAEKGTILEFRTMRKDIKWDQWRDMAMRLFDYIVALNQ